MLKVLISICMCFAISAKAQTRQFEYVDSLLLNQQPEELQGESGNYPEGIDEEERDILSDTTLYIANVRIPADSLSAWKKEKRLAYLSNLDSLLKANQMQDVDDVQEKSTSVSVLQKFINSGLLQGFFWMVAIGFVFFILYKLFLSEGVFRRKSTSAPQQTIEETGHEHSAAEYDKLLHQSVLLGDFRMAVRYIFLKTLALLHEKDHVQISVDKTNYQYVQEISPEKRNEFSALVLTYDYAWYGNFPVSAEMFAGIEKRFNYFLQKL